MRFVRNLVAVLALLLPNTLLLADGAVPALDASAEMRAAVEEVNIALRTGPQGIDIVGQARLDLPSGYGFVPAAPAIRLLTAMGNRPGSDIAGMVVPSTEEGWMLVIRYIGSGYIRDDDARDWNPDELLKDIRAGVNESNAERLRRNLPEVELVGWVEAPHYDSETHRLVWSVASRAKGVVAADAGINYNTLTLGREGHVSMNLVTRLQDIEAQKPIAHALLAALQFKEGKRYADFNEKTDKVAEYGLAALIAGVAAKKLGFFAMAAVFLAKFGKIIAIAVFAAAAAAIRLWRRKS